MVAVKKKKPPVFVVGDRVMLTFGVRSTTGEVVEDRGRLGVGGGQILRVRLDWKDVAEPIEIEVPASELTPA